MKMDQRRLRMNDKNKKQKKSDEDCKYPLQHAKLEELRLEHDLTQQGIGLEIGMVGSGYGNYERGKTILTYELLYRLSAFYDLPLCVLLKIIEAELNLPSVRYSYNDMKSGKKQKSAEIKEYRDYEFSSETYGKLHVTVTDSEFKLLQFYRTREPAVKKQFDQIVNAILPVPKKSNGL